MLGKSIARVLGVVAALYVGICVLAYAKQTDLIFFPTAHGERLEALTNNPANEAFDVAREDAELHGVLLLAPGEDPAPLLIYFGGNGESVSGRARDFAWLRGEQVHLLLLPYRGYDLSTGEPGADALRSDALAAYDQAIEHPRVDRQRIYALGYSLGSGVATYLASQRPLAGLMLAAPFRRLGEIAERDYSWLPVSHLLEHDFDSARHAPDIETPLVVVHGDADTLIPQQHGRDLVQMWGGPSRFISLEGQGHNGSSTHPHSQQALRELLRSN